MRAACRHRTTKHTAPNNPPQNKEFMETIPITISKSLYANWLNDLESGLAPQGQFSLFDGTGYCCLGRLCKIAGRPITIDEDDYANNQGRICGLNYAFTHRLLGDALTAHLTQMNDTFCTFKEIAQYLTSHITWIGRTAYYNSPTPEHQ
jgi:hypothetical protein